MVLHQGILKPGRVIGRQVVGHRSKSHTQQGLSVGQINRLLATGKPNICIIRSLGGIGDVLMTTPMLRALKHKWPESHITYATDFQYMGGSLKDVLLYNPHIDELIQHQVAGSRDYDLKVDVTSVCVMQEKSGVPNVPNRIDLFAQHVGVSLDETGHLPVYIVSDEEQQWAKKKLEQYPRKHPNAIRIGIQVRSSTVARSWPIERVRELAVRLADTYKAQVIVFDSSYGGGPQESWNIAGIIAAKDYGIRQTAALINEVDLMVTPDSGLMHIAGALNKKIVSIWAGSDPASRINHYPNATAVARTDYHCHPCVVGDSNVLTDQGYKQIKDIEVGDYVKTASSKYEKVIKFHKNLRHNRKLIEIMPCGGNESICVTEDHKILVSSAHNKYYCPSDYQPNPQWIPAADIKVNDFLCIPKNCNDALSQVDKDQEDLYWLYGLYMAEGDIRKCVRNYMTRFTLNAYEDAAIAKIKSIVSRLFNRKVTVTDKRPKEETKVAEICCKKLYNQLAKLFGKTHHAATKSIPHQIMCTSLQYLQAFVSGYFYGDGSYGKQKGTLTGWKTFSTSSEKIAYGMQDIYTRFGYFTKVYKYIRDTNYKKNAVIYRVVLKDCEQIQKRWTQDNKYIYTPIRNIKTSERQDEYVYDITVENDPTFTINNFAVYDCWYKPDACNKTYKCIHSITVNDVMEAVQKNLKQPTANNIYSKALDGNNVCVRRDMGGYGDIVCMTSAIEDLKQRRPQLKITFATPKRYHCIFENNPNIDRCIDLSETDLEPGTMVYNFNNIDAAREVEELKHHRNVRTTRPQVYCQAVGGTVDGPDRMYVPKLYMTKQEYQWARERFYVDSKKKYILTALRCAEEYRNWPPEYYYELFALAKQKKKNWRFVLCDGERFEHQIPSNVIDATGFSFRKTIILTGAADCVITPDTSILHVAAAFNKPCAAMFGPIDHIARCQHYRNTIVLTPNLDCIPCWRNTHIPCQKADKMTGDQSFCMSRIKPYQVLEVLEKLCQRLKP